MEFLRRALAAATGREACLATVIRCSGSTPRHPGAKMLIYADGTTFGTIGGGRVELEVTKAGREVAGGSPPRRVVHHLVRDLAMCCGGSMELYLEPLSPSRPALERAVTIQASRQSMDLRTDLDDGCKSLVEPQDPQERHPRIEGSAFVEPIRPRDRALLFGLGHVSRALGPLLSTADFDVVVCDDNDTGALEAELSWAAATVPSFRPGDVETALGAIGSGDFVVILTRDHAIDQDILERLLHRVDLSYLGLIGSHGKVGRFRKRLISKGLFDEDQWKRLRAPIGIDIAAETPAEIAISIAAEMIAIKNKARRGRS